MRLIQQMPAGCGCVFRESFDSVRAVQDNGGIITGPPTIDRGFTCTASNTQKITYGNQRNCLQYAKAATWILRLKTPAAYNPFSFPIGKYLDTGPVIHWLCIVNNVGAFGFYISSAPNSLANSILSNAALSVSTEYHLGCVYDGSLAVGSRGVLYAQGGVLASTITGTLPAINMTSNSESLVIGGQTRVPALLAGYIMRDVRIYNRAFSAAEMLDDYNQASYSKVIP